MNAGGKSDSPIVPKKPANKADGAPSAAESVEGRGLAKGNSGEQTRDRTQRREDLQHALSRVRQAAREDADTRFIALWHHVYNVERLRAAFDSLEPRSAPGIDGETWHHYRENLEENLKDLSQRLQRGAYRAKPVRRVYILKADGRKRPLGIPALEDKIVQRATEVLSRRSQRGRMSWKRMKRYAKRWLPAPRILHPYPHERLRVTTRGRRPVR